MTDPVKELNATARQLKVIHAKLVRIVKTQKEQTKVTARGTRENVRPFFVGDESTTQELKSAVERAIRSRGMTLADLETETGARRNRISGVLVKLQREDVPVINEGDGYRAIWRIR